MANILVVDDSGTYRDIMKEMLKEGGHTVIGEGTNGLEGIDKYKELRPDVITLDITMPILGGMDALRKILEFDPDAKVIMVSASAQLSKVLDAKAMGCADFLAKPFDSLDILTAVSNALNYSVDYGLDLEFDISDLDVDLDLDLDLNMELD